MIPWWHQSCLLQVLHGRSDHVLFALSPTCLRQALRMPKACRQADKTRKAVDSQDFQKGQPVKPILSILFYLFPSCKPIKMSKSKNLGMWAFRFSRAPARLLMNSLSLVAKAGRLKGWWQENGRRMASKCCLIKQHSYFVVWGMLLLSRMFKFSYHDGGAKRERWKQILSRQCAVIYNQQQCFLRW